MTSLAYQNAYAMDKVINKEVTEKGIKQITKAAKQLNKLGVQASQKANRQASAYVTLR